MNLSILNPEVQKYINSNLKKDASEFLFKKQLFPSITNKELVEQIEAKKRCEDKLHTWYHQRNIYYPNKLNIEQTSSETTAKYKAQLVSGKSIIDLTGGFGVDSYQFSKYFDHVIHCEINKTLSDIVTNNFKQLSVNNIKTISKNGIDFIKNSSVDYDVVYIDPSRRNDAKGKVFMLSDCLPNVVEELDYLLEKTNVILIKASPLLDITNGLRELNFVASIHIVAVKNEVKELLFLINKNHSEATKIVASNINHNKTDHFTFQFNNQQLGNYSLPEKYLYEPNAAILKSGGFQEVSNQYNVEKLHQHSHLYTSENLINFPGRRFSIQEMFTYNKKDLRKKFSKKQYNITTRNFPKSVAELRRESHIKDGGSEYLFFTTNLNNEKIVIHCIPT